MNARSISVVIPAYNCARFLPEAVASIRRQTVLVSEIILIDDGSQDGTAEVARACGGDIGIIQQENQGPAAARNVGISRSTGEFIAFLDADDIWIENKMEMETDALLADGNLQMALTHMQLFATGLDGAREWILGPQFLFGFPCGTYRRGLFWGEGRIDESLRNGEDTDWFLRCCEKGIPVKVIPEVGMLYRRHPGSATYGKNIKEKGMLQILKRSLNRRRENQADGGAAASVAWTQLLTGSPPPPKND